MQVTVSERNFDNGFDQDSDIFLRKSLHDQIIRVVTKSPDKNLVLALDDRWGNGKTSFVKMMKSEIIKNHGEELNVIYFDAFENDYQTDPFISLSSKIYELLESEKGNTKKLSEKLLNAGKKLGVSFLTNGTKFAISTLTAGIVNGGVVDKVSDSISESLSSPLEEYIEGQIKSSKAEQKNIEEFKGVLKQIHAVSNKKILFIIDELDRARPDYSLDLLEKIKNLFSVEGFIFLLVVNREQFEKSIECRYGSIDSRLYLNKFIHYWFTLPKIRKINSNMIRGHYTSTIETYLLQLGGSTGLFSKGGTLVTALAYLLDVNNCSLREAERCYSVMAILDNSHLIGEFNTSNYAVAFSLVTYLKVNNPGLIDRLLARDITSEQVLKSLNIQITEDNAIQIALLISRMISYTLLSEAELRLRRNNNEESIMDIESGYSRRANYIEMISKSLDLMHIYDI
ncbi:KAP family P-loop NTPase fold protein [Ewingella americana]